MTDYIACGKVVPQRIADIVRGIAEACSATGTALVGGETAEHPGLLGPRDYDVAGAATGVVEADAILGAERVQDGDVVLAVQSRVCIPTATPSFAISSPAPGHQLRRHRGPTLVPPGVRPSSSRPASTRSRCCASSMRSGGGRSALTASHRRRNRGEPRPCAPAGNLGGGRSRHVVAQPGLPRAQRHRRFLARVGGGHLEPRHRLPRGDRAGQERCRPSLRSPQRACPPGRSRPWASARVRPASSNRAPRASTAERCASWRLLLPLKKRMK